MHDIDEIEDYASKMSLHEYQSILAEIEEHPSWRDTADMEMDYADGNQLDTDLLRRQKELGIPPAVENVIAPALRSLCGYEAITRTDWRVTPNGESGGQDVADALNYKLNQAEKQSKADKACSNAFKTQITCGIGWVEVSRQANPFLYPYRCKLVHRNEIHWDMNSDEPDLSDARWLRRQKWLRPERIAQVFPEASELIYSLGSNGASWYDQPMLDGGGNTRLQNAWHHGRNSTISEMRWYNRTSKELCLVELWYRRWVSVYVIKTPDGRVVEYDEDNENHVMAVAGGIAKVEMANVSKVRRAYWLGNHCLYDGESPYQHNHFPYVPFWGFKEDATGVPFGYVRDMKYPQDSVNSGLSKLRWGMSVVRVERTKGAVNMTDAQLRKQVARPDSDIVLDQPHMAMPGAKFEVHRDYQLTDQHYQMLNDNRATIQRVSDITAGFMGKTGTATSGKQEQLQIEQSNQSLAVIMDNFRQARTLIGEQLMSLILEDMGNDEQAVIVAGDALTPERTIHVNKPEIDEDTGMVYLSNDIQRTKLMVALEDVPSTNSYRGQQLNAFSEVAKSLPAEYQAVMLPFMVSLMDIPNKEKVIEAVKGVQQQQTPEQIQQQIDQAVQEALVKAGNEIKQREIAIKERKADSEIREIDAKSVQLGVLSAYSAMQAGSQIAQIPQIAPIADEVMKGAGYQIPQRGDDPNFPVANMPTMPIQPTQAMPVQENTSPAMPPVPQQPQSPMKGIETPRTTDNLQHEVTGQRWADS